MKVLYPFLLAFVAATTETVAANSSGEVQQLLDASMLKDYFFSLLRESDPDPIQEIPNKAAPKDDVIIRIETELSFFAANMNTFLIRNSFNIVGFEHKIGSLRRKMYDIDFRLEKVTENKLYTQWLLKRFGRQFFAMVEGAERMKRYLRTGDAGDKLVHDLIEITILANSLDNLFSTSPSETQEFEDRAMNLQCQYLSRMEDFRKVSEEKPHGVLIAGYVSKAKRALRGLKDFLNDSSNWGVCP